METRYLNPYVAGVALGLVLLLTIFITGRGLGASGALKSTVVAGVAAVAPAHAAQSDFYGPYVAPGSPHPLKAWLVFEIVGVIVGAFISGLAAGRLKFTTEAGPRVSRRWARWVFAAAGGALFGIGAQLARGCTSGAALSGMAVLSTAGFVTMVAIFGTGYLLAYVGRRLWI